ncbi:lantibiotic dehydratase [Elizabethkingia anophelis]|nr:lantibiotic dehydratase [Elizabethkingia anophelis]MCT4301433.1 lantibiotic dehydratase [Elizabethkingia anophelis]
MMRLDFYNTDVTREPYYSLKELIRMPSNDDDVNDFTKSLFDDNIFSSGIYLSSPTLYEEWEKIQGTNAVKGDKQKRINSTIIKYYIRMCSNPIPFGLFSCYGVGIDKCQGGTNMQQSSYEILTDMDSAIYLTIINDLQKSENVRNVIKYYINNSLYEKADTYRFIEFNDDSETESKNYTLSLVQKNEALTLILDHFKKDHRIEEIVNFLVERIEDVNPEDARNYVEELIDAKVFVSSLDLNLNKPVLDQLISFCNSNRPYWENDEILMDMVEGLNQIDAEVRELNFNMITNQGVNSIREIDRKIKELFDLNESRCCLMINLRKFGNNTDHDTDKITNKLQEAIDVLMLISNPEMSKNIKAYNNLQNFKDEFTRRYGEHAELPLLEVLDNEVGIGYINAHKEEGSFSNLIDDFIFPQSIGNMETYESYQKYDVFWARVILDAIKTGKQSIDLRQLDLSDFDNEPIDIGGTTSIFFSKYNDTLFDIQFSGSSSLNYIGRFTGLDTSLGEFAKQVVFDESKLYAGKMTAEVFHLASKTSGNTAVRKINRPFEISIINKHGGISLSILLSDILISVFDNKVLLKSKKNGKEIIPFFSSAQNYSNDTVPIYHLLCDIQSQYRNNILNLGISSFISRSFNYIPRIVYGETIIYCSAIWKVYEEEVKLLRGASERIELLHFTDFRKAKGIPQFVFIEENGEYKLLLDLENEYQLQIFNDLLKKKGRIVIKGCIYDPIKHPEFFVNENLKFVRLLSDSSKPNYLEKDVRPSITSSKIMFLPGDEWFYYKLYMGPDFSNRLFLNSLNDFFGELCREELIEKWFFIRYKDPDYHLRVRFLANNKQHNAILLDKFSEYLEGYVNERYIWKVEMSSYEREIERYGDDIEISESLFYLSSQQVVKTLSACTHAGNANNLWLFCLTTIDSFLDHFNFDQEGKIEFCHKHYLALSNEYNLKRVNKDSINKKYASSRTEIENFFLEATNITTTELDIQIEDTIKLLIHGKAQKEIDRLASSHIHMHINRFFKTYPRIHELIIYGLLEKYYRKLDALNKKKQ